MDLEVWRYSAFTTDPAGGNPAGVVLADRLPDDERMLAVAAEVGYSETAFLAPRPDGEHDVRYWSPAREVPFCGHATIASAVALADRDASLDRLALHTRTDVVRVEVDRRGDHPSATLTSPPASHEPVDDASLDAALATFGWDRDVLDPGLAPVVAAAGARHLVLAVDTRDRLAAMAYAYEDLRRLMLDRDWTTVAVVLREAPDLLHARNPFPVGGVVEDPATGAAAAAIGGWLRDLGELPGGRCTIRQGDDLGRPSTLLVDADGAAPRVRVTGTAVPLA